MNDASNYSFISPRRQYFLLPYSLICYITEKPTSALGYQKLQQTCKYFFAKKKLIVVNSNVWLNKSYGLYINQVDIPHTLLPSNEKFEYWLTEGFFMGLFEFTRNYIYRWDIQHLWLNKVTVSYNEMDFLVSSKKLKSICWYNLNIIIDNAGDKLTMDKLLSKVPTITQFHYDNSQEILTQETLEKLNVINFKEKFKFFHVDLFKIDNGMDPSDFCNFIKKNAAPESQLSFAFTNDFRIQKKVNYLKLKEAVEKMLQEWPNKNRKPNILLK